MGVGRCRGAPVTSGDTEMTLHATQLPGRVGTEGENRGLYIYKKKKMVQLK